MHMIKNYIFFKRDFIKKINTTSTELDNKYNKDLLINNILELTTNDDRKLIEAYIRLYNDLQSSFTDERSHSFAHL